MLNERSKAGMTVVEVMVAIMILAFSISGVCLLIVKARELSDVARDHYTAVNLAKNRIERVRTFSYDEVDLFLESDVVVDEAGNADDDGKYRRTTTSSVVRDGLKEVVVTIEIMTRSSRQFEGTSEIIRTYIADIPGAPE